MPRRIRLARRLPLVAGAIGLSFFMTACASIVVTSGKDLNGQNLFPGHETIAHIYAENWGAYLFHCIPLITGNPQYPDRARKRDVWRSWGFFRDRVSVTTTVEMLTAEAKSLGATKTTDLATRVTSTMFIPYIIWYSTVEATGNASR